MPLKCSMAPGLSPSMAPGLSPSLLLLAIWAAVPARAAPAMGQDLLAGLDNNGDLVSLMDYTDILEENANVRTDINKLNKITSSITAKLAELADRSEY